MVRLKSLRNGSISRIPEFNGKLSQLSIAPGYYNKIEPKDTVRWLSLTKLIDDKKYAVMDNRVWYVGESAIRLWKSWQPRPLPMRSLQRLICQTLKREVAFVVFPYYEIGNFYDNGSAMRELRALSKTSMRLLGYSCGAAEKWYFRAMTWIAILWLCRTAVWCCLRATGYDPRSGATSNLDPTISTTE